MEKVRRIFVEKKKGFDIEAEHLYKNLIEVLNIPDFKWIRVVNRYDVEGINEEEYRKAKITIFSEPNMDMVYEEKLDVEDGKVFAVEYLPGQYDQRADWAAQCIQILTQGKKPIVHRAKVYVVNKEVRDEDLKRIKDYLINPVDSREASLDKPEKLSMEIIPAKDVEIIESFINMDLDGLGKLKDRLNLAMTEEDLIFIRDYFRDREKRNPTVTEIKVIDTYWSDHCRHGTFLTKIEDVHIDEGKYNEPVIDAYLEYLKSRSYVYGDEKRYISLMDIAVMGMKELRKKGLLDDLDVSDEINACTIEIDVDVDGEKEKWLLLFKNETHNHPTEIEPFGGAATCLGGAIRDPLSGRAYVYQAMRVTGSGDPRTRIEDTLPGKLPQRKITTEAADGYSSYGNQVGLATGQVTEYYDENFVAKRMELGAVIGAVPKKNVRREKPTKGDIVLLVGGRTGRDGCGGATGSSKEHTEESIYTAGAEVQKGDAPLERRLIRLFRNPKASRLIKKCNDFGAGGVSVAIGELADSIEINLDSIPKKYEGLDGTELAISESQERMAVVIDRKDLDTFISLAKEENLEATPVAEIKSNGRLVMKWRGKKIVDISRDFLNTSGVTKKAKVRVLNPKGEAYFKKSVEKYGGMDLRKAWLENLQDLNVACQKGLVERFDSTIGSRTVLMPFGGKYQLTPVEGMVAKIPVESGETDTASVMTHGYDPKLAKWSPFYGGLYAVIHSVAKVVAMGGDYRTIRLSLQEYFEKLGRDETRWGKPFSALLGAFYVQKKLNIPAIGGKDSMSGTFKDMDVPPTLVSFAVNTVEASKVISPEFKGENSQVVLVKIKKDERYIPDFKDMERAYGKIKELIDSGKILSAHTVGYGGIAAAISKMSFGNKIGFRFNNGFTPEDLFMADYGSIILEVKGNLEDIEDLDYILLGSTQRDKSIVINGEVIDIEEAIEAWKKPLNKIFPIKEDGEGKPQKVTYTEGRPRKASVSVAKPLVFIPVFPGTNCEDDMTRAFLNTKARVEHLIFKNLSSRDIEESLLEMERLINMAQIIAIPGGFSASDEPDGSGKFIATVFRNPRIKEAVMNFLKHKDGLILGICNGFQALIKLGLLPYGEIRDIDEDSPTLTFNKIGRHVSTIALTRVSSNLSPWFSKVDVGDIHRTILSHGEGRFVASREVLDRLIAKGQIATQYVDFDGEPSYDGEFNVNGSIEAVEGITSEDGRILGKMGHSERIGKNLYKNVPGELDQRIFEGGVEYFK